MIRNKMAHLFALAFKQMFPAKWQSFFADIATVALSSVDTADIFVRVMLAINEEVADRDIERSRAEAERSTSLKDNMRILSMSPICDTWHAILTTYETSHPEVVGRCLQCISLYVSWIDVNLIANDSFLTPVFLYLTSPVDSLREGACDLIIGLVDKGMPPNNKIQLLKSLHVVERVSLARGMTHGAEDIDYVVKLATVTNHVGEALLASINR